MNKIGKDLNLAAQILLEGGIISFPTETVMGLGIVYDNFDAYNRLNKIKGRPENKPYTMMVKSPKDISQYAYVDERAQKVIDNFLPGPLTILLKSKENVPTWVTHGTGIIGIRVPDFPIINEILNLVNKPLLVPSANPSNCPPALTVEQVNVYFANALDYIVNNNSYQRLPSTIVDLTQNEIKVVREGEIKRNFILKVTGD